MPLKVLDRKYTTFEANECLVQHCKIPFGITNRAAIFQKAMYRMATEKNLYSAFPYTNNITTVGQTQEKYYENVKISEEIYNEQVEYCGISMRYHCVRLLYWEQWSNLILNDCPLRELSSSESS